MEKYRRAAGQAADGNIIIHMRIACWVTKATNTHTEYIILIAFPLQKMVRRTRLIYFVRPLPVL